VLHLGSCREICAVTLLLLDHFREVEDLGAEHVLIDIVGLTICAVIYGADTWIDIESFSKSKEAWLRKFLLLPNGIPSHHTIARLFAALDTEQLQTYFLAWVKASAQIKVDKKSNEITAIPELLKALDLQGYIVTIDAMGTQTNIAEQIQRIASL
jgi:hypothetical protein